MLDKTYDPKEIEEFTAVDPYVEAGVVTGYKVEPWTVVTP